MKTMFASEDGKLLRYIAAVCDTKRIESNAEKMKILLNLLHTYGVSFEILGGATNRIALQIEGYAVKFAIDEQGYRDNLVEYSLSAELQPYVTKSYETNGYILIAQCVELMTKKTWVYHKTKIIKILDILSRDYLLGDVGYIDKNMTNWGLIGTHPVILDYAYMHRLNEALFICDRCGKPLTYDGTYDIIMCSGHPNCKATYTYNERKVAQGKALDDEMIDTQLKHSIILPEGESQKEVTVMDNRALGHNEVLIDTPGDYARFLRMQKEREEMRFDINCLSGDDDLDAKFDAFVDSVRNGVPENTSVIFDNLSEDDELVPVYTENYQEKYMSPSIPSKHYASRSPIDGDGVEYIDDEEGEYFPDVNEDEEPDDLDAAFDAFMAKIKSQCLTHVEQVPELSAVPEEKTVVYKPNPQRKYNDGDKPQKQQRPNSQTVVAEEEHAKPEKVEPPKPSVKVKKQDDPEPMGTLRDIFGSQFIDWKDTEEVTEEESKDIVASVEDDSSIIDVTESDDKIPEDSVIEGGDDSVNEIVSDESVDVRDSGQ